MANELGHLGYVFSIIGMILLSLNKRLGWAFRFIGEAIWISVGVLLDMDSIYIWGGIFMCIDLLGLVMWRKE